MAYLLVTAAIVLIYSSSLDHVESFSPKLVTRVNSKAPQLLMDNFNPFVTHQQRISAIFMSDTTQEDKTNDINLPNAIRAATSKILRGGKYQLPPSPENRLILGGDVLVLFLYSFLDHLLNYLSDHVNTEASIVGLHASWLDRVHLPPEFLAATTQMPQFFHYSPALQSAGICAVTISTLWLISAYFNEAFSYENTVHDSERAVLVTGKTWLYTGAGMIAIALASDSMLCGCPMHRHIGHLTKCDADFIFDSIGSLLCWRYMMSQILRV